MPAVSDFPVRFAEHENVFIPLANGMRLAAKLWIPEKAAAAPVPVILEYLPYRKRDRQAVRDSQIHRYLAGHGYACARVDLRGSGDSDGLMFDEYLAQEQDDALEVIAWLARQPWCSGAVGMMGISWGGFNALQVAARRPPALKAIITLCSTDDRYADDMHYMGGCLLMDLVGWGATFFAYFGAPPDPALVGERWRAMWLERLENAPLPTARWLRHQLRDEFWKHGSVCEEYARIACPVYAVGGWADGYTNAIPRLLRNLQVPRKGLIGPWGHTYPNLGGPGPAIGFLQETLRWWDHWLKGRDTGIMDEPMLRAWMLESEKPRTFYARRAGRWVAEEVWPSARIATRELAVHVGGLGGDADSEHALVTRSPPTVGLASADWCPYGLGHDMPDDQRIDDGLSLTFDSEPLAERLELLGAPRLALDLAVDRPSAFIVARLCDVAPTGESVLVTYGVLNLTHRQGHERIVPLEPGRRVSIALDLNHVAYALAPGHRLRLALSTSYWPVVWPSPAPVTLTVFAGGACRLGLPVRPARAEDASLRAFGPPEHAEPVAHTVMRVPRRGRQSLTVEPQSGEFRLVSSRDRSAFRLPDIDLEHSGDGVDVHSIRRESSLSARSETSRTLTFVRGDWRVRVDTRTMLTATEDFFLLTAELDAYEADIRIVTRRWAERIPRTGV